MATRAQLADAVEARLRTIPTLEGYRGVPSATPATVSDVDLRVKGYWVLATTPGGRNDERISGDLAGLLWGFQVKCVTGVPSWIDGLVDQVEAALVGWRPYPETGRCRLNPYVDDGPARPDRGETPVRYWLPLLFQIQT